MNFGEKLKALRKQRGWTQVETTNRINQQWPDMRLSQTSLSALEQQETAPRETVLDPLSSFYGVSIMYWFNTIVTRPDRKRDVKRYINALRLYTPDSYQYYHFGTGGTPQRGVRQKPTDEDKWWDTDFPPVAEGDE